MFWMMGKNGSGLLWINNLTLFSFEQTSYFWSSFKGTLRFFFTSVVFCLSYKLIPWGGIGLGKEYILVLHIHIQRKLPSCKRREKVKNLLLLAYRFLLLFCCYCENGENQESKHSDSMKRKEGATNHLWK